MKKTFIFFIALAGYIFIGIQEAIAQCAMCRATVENNVSAGDPGIASGLNFGIMYLFITPYLAIMVIAYFWYKSSKKNARKVRPASPYRS